MTCVWTAWFIEKFINAATTSHKTTICENRTEETSAKTYDKSTAASLHVFAALFGLGTEVGSCMYRYQMCLSVSNTNSVMKYVQ